MIGASALVWASLVALSAPPALPDPDEPARYDLGLNWRHPSCGDLDAVYAQLHRLAPTLSLAPVGQPAHVEVEAEVRETDGTWLIRLDLQASQGRETRTFAAESCAIAIEATALVLAVAVDPVAVATTIETQREVRGTPEPTPEPRPEPTPTTPPPEPSPEPVPRERAPWTTSLILDLPDDPSPPRSRPGPALRVGLAVLGGGGYGPLDTGQVELGIRIALLGRSWRVEARGLGRPPLRAAVETGGFLTIDGGVGGLRGCGVLRSERAPLEFPLCGGVEAGPTRARAGGGIANAGAATQPYVGLELGPGLAWTPVERFALGLEFGALVPLGTGGFSLSGQTELANLPIGVRALLALEVRLP